MRPGVWYFAAPMKMRSVALFGASLLVTLATACGDDGGNNNGSCGDGHTTGAEQCDDGNTTNGDGCSSTCKNESSGPRCGDSNVDVATEQCDDGNTTAGDGCSATCQNENAGMCGNGAINGSEACDDGNTANSDGCSSTCVVESGYTCTGTPSVCTMGGGMATCSTPKAITFMAMGTDMVGNGTGNTTTATSGQAAGPCDGDTAGAGPDATWTFTTTGPKDVVILLNDTTTFDGGIRLTSVACNISTEIVDILGADDGCSDSQIAGGTEALGYINLPAGTYFLTVDGYQATDLGMYDFTVTLSPPGCGNGMVGPLELCDDGNTQTGDGCDATCGPEMGWNCNAAEPSVCQMEGCGDGLLQMGEVCDDDNVTPGDGCSATCQVESGFICDGGEPTICVMAGCGNGVIEPATEECDDGNLTNGDRCSSTCILESDVTEAGEPNNTVPQVLTPGNHIVRGQYTVGDVDLYTFTLAQPATVEIETYVTINGTTTDYTGRGSNAKFDCLGAGDDHKVALFAAGVDTTMQALALAVDFDDGDFFCSYLGPNDSTDDGNETGMDVNQLKMLPAGTYTIRVADDDSPGSAPVAGRYMLDLKIGGGTGPVAPAAGDLAINEFLAFDGSQAAGGADSNCDASFTNADDEFVELVNVSNKTLDLTGVTISDSLQVEFTFGATTNLGTGTLTLAPGKAVTVWAGGVPACPGVTNWFTPVATQHTLSLNDGGDTITVKTAGATPVTIATTTYGQATIATSFNLSPDVTGTVYALHTAVAGAVGKISPGKKANNTAF